MSAASLTGFVRCANVSSMSVNDHVPISRFRILERVSATVPALADLDSEIHRALSELSLPQEKLRGRRIAVTAGSRGIASLAVIVRAVCNWLKNEFAIPFVIPAMGSHGGATAEGQRALLAGYGVTSENVGAEVVSSMEAECIGKTADGFPVYMDRNAWEADSVLVMNRVKPHTDFTGGIESGLLKMMAVGMGKAVGAREYHHWSRKHGQEKLIRAMSAVTLGSGKILAGLGVIENELHQICSVRAARPGAIVATEEDALRLARTIVPRLPAANLHLLIVDEMGKNISGTGMDTKVIGRGVKLGPGEAPEIRLIYARDLTAESGGNALGVGLADVIHDRLYLKIDFEKTYINVRTSLNPPMARLPIHFSSDREALDFALGALGSPGEHEQRIIWVRNSLDLGRIAVSDSLTAEVAPLNGWRLSSEAIEPRFNPLGNVTSPIA